MEQRIAEETSSRTPTALDEPPISNGGDTPGFDSESQILTQSDDDVVLPIIVDPTQILQIPYDPSASPVTLPPVIVRYQKTIFSPSADQTITKVLTDLTEASKKEPMSSDGRGDHYGFSTFYINQNNDKGLSSFDDEDTTSPEGSGGSESVEGIYWHAF